MFKIFMEYKVKEGQREAYIREMQAVKKLVSELGGVNYSFYEGEEQPLLFVEMFDTPDYTVYEMIKQKRCGEPTAIDSFIVGGREKIHMWAFREIDL